jgi:hypothetical protein
MSVGRRWNCATGGNAGVLQGCAMTGRNPWVVLGIAEDAPYLEVQSAFRRRVKQTHPDGGGDAAEFVAVVDAFDAVRQTCPRPSAVPKPGRCTSRPTPYDQWLRPLGPTRTWTDGDSRAWAADGPSTAPDPVAREFGAVLLGEMTRVGAL